MRIGKTAGGELRPAAAGGRGRRGAVSAAVEKCKDQREPAAFFASPQGGKPLPYGQYERHAMQRAAALSGAQTDQDRFGKGGAAERLSFRAREKANGCAACDDAAQRSGSHLK